MWIENWKEVAKKAASMWCLYGATIAGSIAAIQSSLNESSTEFQVLSVLLAICGMISRLVSQPGLHANAKQCVGNLKD